MKLKMLPPRALLTLPDSSQVEVERIGRGRYTTAWKNGSHVYAQTNRERINVYGFNGRGKKVRG